MAGDAYCSPLSENFIAKAARRSVQIAKNRLEIPNTAGITARAVPASSFVSRRGVTGSWKPIERMPTVP